MAPGALKGDCSNIRSNRLNKIQALGGRALAEARQIGGAVARELGLKLHTLQQ